MIIITIIIKITVTADVVTITEKKSHLMALIPQRSDRRSAAWYIPCILFGTGRASHVFLKDQSVQEELSA